MTRFRRLPACCVAAVSLFVPALACVADAPAGKAAAREAPMTKSEERERFHSRVTGMPAKDRLEGYGQRAAMEAASPFSALTFRNIGPEVQGGRIVAIQVPRNRPDTLLVAFASGGLFRTENRGGSWTPLFDHESTLTIGDIALGDGDGTVLWVGTGENNSSRTSYAGTGVFKSTDAGKTWKNMGLTDSHHIGKVVVDAKDPNTVFVAAMGHLYSQNDERGVYKTTDGGASWRKSLFVDDRTGAIDLAQDPSRPNVLFAAMWERDRRAWNFLESGPGSGLYKSIDSGATWKKLAGGFPQGDTVGRIGLVVAPGKPDIVYAVLDNQARRPDSEILDERMPPGELTARRLRGLSAEKFGRLDPAVVQRFLQANDFPKKLKAARLLSDVKSGKTTIDDVLNHLKDANRDLFENQVVQAEVYRSDDGGASWKKTHEGRIEQIFFSYGYYFARIAVAPDDPNRVYFGGLGLLMSTDGGASWKGIDRRGVHADHHVVAFFPNDPRQVAIGTDGGLNLSWDAGETWTTVNNLPVGQFTTIAVDDGDPYNVVGGLQDNGVLRGPSSYVYGKMDPSVWKAIGGGDGSMVQIDSKDRNRVYLASQFGFANRVDVKTGDRQRIRPRHELKEPPLRYNWVTPFLISPHSRDILYFGTQQLMRSFDRGDTWTPISTDLTGNREQGDVPFGTITSIAESPKKFGMIWVGTDEGKVWGTKDGGASWSDLSKGLAPDRWVTRVVASAFDEGTVYVSQSGYREDDFAAYLWRSTDQGATWQSLAAGLPTEPVNVVREDPKAKHLLYAGTDLGAYVSVDRGATWIPLTGGLPHVAVHDLAVQPREGDLVLGTHGRSAWVAEAAPLRKLSEEVRKKDLYAFPVKKAQWDRRRGYSGHPYIKWFENPLSVRVAWWASPAGAGAARLTVKDSYGNVWKEIAATSAAGLNVYEYDLSADAARADASEAAVRQRQMDKQKAQEELDKRFAPAKDEAKDAAKEPAKEATKEATKAAAAEDEDDDGPAASGGPEKPMPPDLLALLADPYRGKRTRTLPPGTYTIEITAAGKTSKTTLDVKTPKKEDSGGDDDDPVN
jgi:photosystem II stability/assembly factor-like uncharacterized protein